MKKLAVTAVIIAGALLSNVDANAQYRTDAPQKSEAQLIMESAEASETPVIITLEQALEIALSENVSVKVADMEIKRAEYAKKGSYASLFPQIDASGAYQRTIKKQVMYMDFDMSSLMGGGAGTEGTEIPDGVEIPETGATDSAESSTDNGGGIEMGRWNTWSAGLSAAMPLVNAQLWASLKISGMDVELAVEKARASRLDMVTQVKNAYFSTLLAKEAFEVYKQVYENAVQNLAETQKKYDVQKVSEMELLRAKTTVANAIPNVYNAEGSVILALWQLKAVLGVDLDMNIPRYEREILAGDNESFYTPAGYRYFRQILLEYPAEVTDALKPYKKEVEKAANAVADAYTSLAQAAATVDDWTELDEPRAAYDRAVEALDAVNRVYAEKRRALTLPALQDRIDEIDRRLGAGIDFLSLISVYSADTTDQNVSGTGYPMHPESQGWPADFIDAVMSLEKPGDVSGPVLTEKGVHILYYDSDAPAGDHVLTDEEMEVLKESALYYYQTQALVGLFDEWKPDFDIETHPELLKY